MMDFKRISTMTRCVSKPITTLTLVMTLQFGDIYLSFLVVDDNVISSFAIEKVTTQSLIIFSM